MFKKICSFYNEHFKRPQYIISYVLFILFSYGFSLSRNTINIDDFAAMHYGGLHGNMMSRGRWGDVLYNFLINSSDFSPYIYKFVATALMATAGFLFACLLYSFNDGKKKIPTIAYMLTSSIFVSSPWIFDFWRFSGTELIVAADMVVVFASLLHLIYGRRKYIYKILITGCAMSVVASSYEGALVLYVFMALFFVFYKYCINNKSIVSKIDWVKDGSKLIPSAVLAVVLRIVIAKILQLILGVTPTMASNSQIVWGNFSIQNAQNFLSEFLYQYVLFLQYFPVLLFVIALILFMIVSLFLCFKNNRILPGLLGFLCVLSIFSLEILSFNPCTMAYRTKQSIIAFIAITIFIVFSMLVSKKKIIIRLFSAFAVMLTIYQASYLSQLFEVWNLRSDNEVSVVSQIGFNIKSDFDDKKVMLAGTYEFSDYINKNIMFGTAKNNITNQLFRNISENYGFSEWTIMQDFSSVINWANCSQYEIDGENMIERFFSYCGYDLDIENMKNEEMLIKYSKIAEDEKMKPYEAKDMGDYILVYLGPLKNPSKYFYK